MKRPADVLAEVATRYDRNWANWACSPDDIGWPATFSIWRPQGAAINKDREGAGDWIQAWEAFGAEYPEAQVQWASVQTVAGRQLAPVRLRVPDAATVARLADRADHWCRARRWSRAITGQWLDFPVRSVIKAVVGLPDSEIERVLGVAQWLRVNPRSGLMPRQLPVEGIDTKWVSSRYKALSALTASGSPTTPATPESSDLSPGISANEAVVAMRLDALGFRPRPTYVRLAVLDPALRAYVGGLRDLAVVADQLPALAWRPDHVVVIENLETAVTLPEIAGTVVIHSLGHNVEPLRHLEWARTAPRITYWGDIDAEGFAILDRVREMGYAVESILMDGPTLLSHRRWAISEDTQPRRGELRHLTDLERAAYNALQENLWGKWLRLEQERLPLGLGVEALREPVRSPRPCCCD